MPELLTKNSIISEKSVDNELGICPAGNQRACWGRGLSSGLRVCGYVLWPSRTRQLLLTPLVTTCERVICPGYCSRGEGWIDGSILH